MCSSLNATSHGFIAFLIRDERDIVLLFNTLAIIRLTK